MRDAAELFERFNDVPRQHRLHTGPKFAKCLVERVRSEVAFEVWAQPRSITQIIERGNSERLTGSVITLHHLRHTREVVALAARDELAHEIVRLDAAVNHRV